MKTPFWAIWISYMLGIYLGHNYQIGMGSYEMPLLLSASFFVASRIVLNRKGYVFALMFAMLLGGHLYGQDYNLGTVELGEVKDLEGIITEERNREEDYERYAVRLTGEGYGRKDRMIILTLYENTDIGIGDRILIDGEASEFRENTNPKLFNQKNYYKSQYIHKQLVSRGEDILILDRNQLGRLEQRAYDFRGRVEKVIDGTLREEQRGLLKSMILGKSSYMGHEELSTFRELGLGHMIAVSGLHIGILYGAIMFILNRALSFHKRLAELASLSTVWCYIILIGSPVSSVRAGLMISLYLLGKLLVRRADAINIISAVGLGMLVYRPLWLLSVGYILSFAGTVVIVTALSRKRDPLLSVILGLSPLNVYYFNVLPVISLVSNLIVAPLLSLALILGMAMVAISYVSTAGVQIMARLVGGLLYLNELCLEGISNLYRTIYVRTPELYELVFSYVIVGILIGAIDLRVFDRRLLKCTIGYTVGLALFFSILPKANVLEVDFLDVGQGDCALVRFSDKTYLVDSGGSLFSRYDVGERVVYPYLLKHGLTELDGFIISHFHADHMKGFLHFADRISVKEIIIGHRNEESELYNQLIEVSRQEEIPINHIESDMTYRVDKDSVIYLIPPSETIQKLKDENNNSLLVLLESFGRRILFTGDVEEERERELSSEMFLADIDLLKVPHHGSPTSSTEDFLKLTSPRCGVIQVGKNRYGHPSPEVLARYQELGTDIYRNDISGMVKLTVDKKSYYIEEYLREKETVEELLFSLRREMLLIVLQLGIWLILLEEYRVGREVESLDELQRIFEEYGWR